MGGGYPLEDNNSLYALPYVYSNWPDTVDAFAHVAVVNAGAILRKEPAANADAICTLERVILQANYEKSYPQQQKGRQLEWWHVQSADGNTQGYLSHTDVYSPVGYRAILNRNKQGKWQLTALVAGD